MLDHDVFLKKLVSISSEIALITSVNVKLINSIEAGLKRWFRLDAMFFTHVIKKILKEDEFLTTPLLGAFQLFGQYLHVDSGNVVTHISPLIADSPKITFAADFALEKGVFFRNTIAFNSMPGPIVRKEVILFVN